MKCAEKPVAMKMSDEIFHQLVTEVKETLATNIKLPKPKKRSFGVVDMWKIRRDAKSAIGLVRR
jgi:hypothetical protein